MKSFLFPLKMANERKRNVKSGRKTMVQCLQSNGLLFFVTLKVILNHSVIWYYYTSESLWKIWLVESIQSIHNSLWTWNDKCNICCRYCIYHVKFNVCLFTKPFGVFSSETKWLNASLLFLRMNYMCKCIIKQLLLNSVFAWYHE